jgi:endonuclease-3
MSAANRQALITKTFKVLKKYYEPTAPPADRPVLEHLLYACCLESAKFDHVDEVFAKLEQNYFDWNEVRVTTVAELAEVMALLPDAADAARRLKRTLQSVFETHYSFELEFLKKQNLGKAIEQAEKLNGVSPFGVAYLTQNALAGHAIPLCAAAFEVLQLLGIISEADAAKRRVPGMERAIPKNKGVEFGSLLHQLSVDYAATPHSPRIRAILLEIAPDAKDRFPKRTTKKEGEAPESGTAAPPRGAKPPQAAPPPSRRSAAKAGEQPERPRRPAGSSGEESSTRAKSSSKRLTRKKPR